MPTKYKSQQPGFAASQAAKRKKYRASLKDPSNMSRGAIASRKSAALANKSTKRHASGGTVKQWEDRKKSKPLGQPGDYIKGRHGKVYGKGSTSTTKKKQYTQNEDGSLTYIGEKEFTKTGKKNISKVERDRLGRKYGYKSVKDPLTGATNMIPNIPDGPQSGPTKGASGSSDVSGDQRNYGGKSSYANYDEAYNAAIKLGQTPEQAAKSAQNQFNYKEGSGLGITAGGTNADGSPAWTPDTGASPGETVTGTGEDTLGTPTDGSVVDPATGETIDAPEPTNISEAVDAETETYREQAESEYKGSYLEAAENFENIFGRPAPFSTEAEFLEWRATQSQEDLDYLDQQQGYAREIEKIEFQKAKEAAAGAEASTSANMAQGREGAMAGTAAQYTTEFKEQMARNMQQAEVQKASAEASRQKAMIDLKRAQEAGDIDLAEAIEGKIDGIEREIRQADSDALKLAIQSNQQNLDYAKFEHSMSMDQQANYRANFNMFNEMVGTGAEMTTGQIVNLSETLNIPFNVANDYYEGAQLIRDDKSLDQQTKAIALSELQYDFDEKVQGIRGAQAQAVSDFVKLSQSGNWTQAQLEMFATNMNIPNDMNPLYLAKKKLDTSNAAIKAYEAANLGQPPDPNTKAGQEYIKLKNENAEAAADLQAITGRIADSTYEGIFFQPGTNRSARSIVGGDNIRECGEGFNDVTDGPRMGNPYYSGYNADGVWEVGKFDHVREIDPRSNPQVGNGIVTTRGGTTNGHVETVLAYDPITQTVTTGGWNYNGDGKWNVNNFTLDQLNSDYGDQWGFTNSKLKQKYIEPIKETQQGIAISRMEYDDAPEWFQNYVSELYANGDRSESQVIGYINDRVDITDKMKEHYIALFNDMIDQPMTTAANKYASITDPGVKTVMMTGDETLDQTWRDRKQELEDEEDEDGFTDAEIEAMINR